MFLVLKFIKASESDKTIISTFKFRIFVEVVDMFVDNFANEISHVRHYLNNSIPSEKLVLRVKWGNCFFILLIFWSILKVY